MNEISLELGAFVAAILSFMVSICSFVYTNYQSKRQRTAEIITTNRVEWMQKFKEYIASYIENIESVTNDFVKCRQVNINLEKILAQIKLHLNTLEDPDKELVYVMESVNVIIKNCVEINKPKLLCSRKDKKESEKIFIDKLLNAKEIIIVLSQIYLKTEWERVKVEAESGKFAEFNFNKNYLEMRHKFNRKIDINKKVLDIDYKLSIKEEFGNKNFKEIEPKFTIAKGVLGTLCIVIWMLFFKLINILTIIKYGILVLLIIFTLMQVVDYCKYIINRKF